MTAKKIRILFFCRERYPTSRVDIEVLFGQQLVETRGHEIDCIMQAESEGIGHGPREWHGRTVWIGRGYAGRTGLQKARRYISDVLHDLRSLLRIQSYDAVQVRDKFLIGSIALVVARIVGRKFFFWLSFPIPDNRIATARQGTSSSPRMTLIRGLISRWLLKYWILPFSDHVFLQSERMRVALLGEAGRRERISIVPMGISDDEVTGSRYRARISRGDGCVELAYLGTLDPGRHLDMLLRMLRLLRATGVPARLVMIGGGGSPTDAMALQEIARSEGVTDHVEFTGMLPRQQALARLQHAQICLSPIYPSPILDMGSPTKLVEYMAMGFPVVANHHPEQRIILRQCKGGLCVPWGERHFAKAVRYLLSIDVAARVAMGERGREWALASRSYSTIADELEQVYWMALSSDVPVPEADRTRE